MKLGVAAFALMLLASLTSAALAAPLQDSAAAPSQSKEKIADDKIALKREVQMHNTKAEHYTLEAEKHREAIKAAWKKYKQESKKIANLPKSANENPYLKKLRQQTEREVAELEDQHDAALTMARYHQTKIKELLDQEKYFSTLK